MSLSSEDLEKFKKFMEDFCYKHLIATPKAEEFSIEFYRMELKKQRATERDYRKLAKIFANIASEKMNSVKGNLGQRRREKIVKDSLKEAWELYSRE